jgi:anaerobic selenocysteine-containing dehydrogenase
VTIETKHTFCRLCEVMCGLTVTLSDGEISKVRGDAGHPVSQGFACNKGLLSLDVHRDPDRLDHPLRRDGARWEPVSWDDASSGIAARLQAVIDEHGPESVALYIGNPAAFNTTAGPAGAMFLLSLGGTKLFSAATQDCANKFTVSEILFGSPTLHPVADLDRTDHLLLIGTNPRISKSSFLSVPDPITRIRAVADRGGKVTFVNPLRIEPDVGETVQVRPDTDAYLLAAMLQHIDRTIGFDLAEYGDHVDGVDQLRDLLAAFSPERVAPVVGVEPETIEQLATSFATAPSAAVHASTGLNMGRQGSLAYFLVHMLSLVTGNLGRPGGNVAVGRAIPADDAMLPRGRDSLEETPFGAVRRSRGSLPGALLADWIRRDDQPIRALVCIAGNPLLSFGGAAATADGLADLDLLVSIDYYRNATGELADYLLPAADWYERPDLSTFTQGTQLVPHIQYTDAVVAPRAERRTEADIFGLLSAAMGIDPVFPPGPDGVALANDGVLAAGGLTVADLATRDRGLAVLDDATPPTVVPDALRTPDGRLDCAPVLLVEAFERARQLLEEDLSAPADQLRLITRRTRNTLNSALANVAKLKDRGADTNPLYMHPDDAAARGLGAGDRATVTNDVGAIEAPVALDENLRPGVVAMTHGFGYAANPGMAVAHAHPGVNVNVLSPAGPGTFEPLSGMTHLTGIPVDVAAARTAT